MDGPERRVRRKVQCEEPAPTRTGESEHRRPTRRLSPRGQRRLCLPRLVEPIVGFDPEPDVGVEAEHLFELERRPRLDRRLARDNLADQLG